jgi:lysophospholipase L1-like esterase
MRASSAGQRRRLSQLLLGAGVVALLFALLEGGLRLARLGDDTRTSILAYQEVYLPALVPDELPDGTPVWRTWDPRVPFQCVPRAKAPNALRVFTFGGSAMAGLGFSPNVTVARHLEELLARSHPDRVVEVVNLGLVAIASKQVRLLVEDAVAHYDPDLVVVYSGNNEFLEVHAEKYAAVHATTLSRVRAALSDTNLVRLLQRARSGPPGPADLPDRNFETAEEERLTQARIIEDIEVREDEVAATIAAYAANLAAMVDAARAHGVPIVLCSVAVNWEWSGREDTRLGWLASGPGAPRTPQDALPAVEAELASFDGSPTERWTLLHRRAELLAACGERGAAEVAYRAALDADPHMRRATGRHAAAVARVAAEHGAVFLDTIEALATLGAERRLVGFEDFYDYVHFTPHGAAAVACAVFERSRTIDALRGTALELQAYPAEHAAEVAARTRDYLDGRRFLGIGGDPGRVTERDLWKYDKLLIALDERIAADPADALSLAYRGLARSFRQDGARGAARDLRRALELGLDEPGLRETLARLEATRRLAPRGE